MTTPQRRPKVKNIKAWRTVYNAVRNNPLYLQDRFAYEADRNSDAYMPGVACGAPACIAGSGCLALGLITPRRAANISRKQCGRWLWSDLAGTLGKRLGLTKDQADVLFDASPDLVWPEPYRAQWSRVIRTPILCISDAFAHMNAEKEIALALLEDVMYKRGPSILDWE